MILLYRTVGLRPRLSGPLILRRIVRRLRDFWELQPVSGQPGNTPHFFPRRAPTSQRRCQEPPTRTLPHARLRYAVWYASQNDSLQAFSNTFRGGLASIPEFVGYDFTGYPAFGAGGLARKDILLNRTSYYNAIVKAISSSVRRPQYPDPASRAFQQSDCKQQAGFPGGEWR